GEKQGCFISNAMLALPVLVAMHRMEGLRIDSVRDKFEIIDPVRIEFFEDRHGRHYDALAFIIESAEICPTETLENFYFIVPGIACEMCVIGCYDRNAMLSSVMNGRITEGTRAID